eukprot:gene1198-biopygen9470
MLPELPFGTNKLGCILRASEVYEIDPGPPLGDLDLRSPYARSLHLEAGDLAHAHPEHRVRARAAVVELRRRDVALLVAPIDDIHHLTAPTNRWIMSLLCGF